MTRSHRSIERRPVAGVAGASLLGALLARSPVAAQVSTIYPPVDSCTVSPASVSAGGTLSFSCQSGTFSANEPVTITVTGEAWKRHAFGVMLTEPVHLEGPQGGASTRIAGYALLLDGKQVAWCERSMPLPIAPGQRVTIADDILF